MLATLVTASESGCMFKRLAGFAKTGYKKTTTVLKSRATAAAIGSLPLLYTSYDEIKKWQQVGKDRKTKEARIKQFELDKQLAAARETHNSWWGWALSGGTSGATLKKLESLKTLSLAIEKETKISGIKWYVNQNNELSRPLENTININHETDKNTLAFDALREAGRLDSSTSRLNFLSKNTVLFPNILYILSCIACPPIAKISSLAVRVALSKFLGNKVQNTWDSYEEVKAYQFASKSLLKEFKAGKTENKVLLQSVYDSLKKNPNLGTAHALSSLTGSDLTWKEFSAVLQNTPLKKAPLVAYALWPYVGLHYVHQDQQKTLLRDYWDPEYRMRTQCARVVQNALKLCEKHLQEKDFIATTNQPYIPGQPGIKSMVPE
jgi:hypothetical protein